MTKKTSSLTIIILISIVLLLVSGAGLTPFQTVLNPGFEGAKVYLYGTRFNGFPSDWQGANTLHKYDDAEETLVYHTAQLHWDRIYWGGTTQPSNPTVTWDWSDGVAKNDRLQLGVEIQSQVPLDYQLPTPLQLSNTTEQDEGELIQYWRTEEVTTGTETSYTLTKQDLLLVPAEFHITFYIPPGQSPTKHVSGWQEGDWSQIECSFIVFWHNWMYALQPYIENDPDPPELPDEAYNRESMFELKGGVPITGWIENFRIPFETESGIIYDAISWKTSDGETYADAQFSGKADYNNFKAKVQFSPSLEGRFIDLFTGADANFDYPLPDLQGEEIENYAWEHVPDPTMTPTQYFKINIVNFGTYTTGDWYHGYTVYYPVVDFRLRFIFGIYGKHTYLWTEETAEENKYPGWEDRTTTVTVTPGVSSWFEWLYSPWTWLGIGTALIFLALILFVALLFLVPEFGMVLGGLFKRRSRGKGG